jgi:hypothetical protein
VVQGRQTTDLEEFIQKLCHSYRSYLSLKDIVSDLNHWPRYQLIPIRKDIALFDCIKSLEFKPVETNLVNNPVSYPWSSCSYRVWDMAGGILDKEQD